MHLTWMLILTLQCPSLAGCVRQRGGGLHAARRPHPPGSLVHLRVGALSAVAAPAIRAGEIHLRPAACRLIHASFCVKHTILAGNVFMLLAGNIFKHAVGVHQGCQHPCHPDQHLCGVSHGSQQKMWCSPAGHGPGASASGEWQSILQPNACMVAHDLTSDCLCFITGHGPGAAAGGRRQGGRRPRHPCQAAPGNMLGTLLAKLDVVEFEQIEVRYHNAARGTSPPPWPS